MAARGSGANAVRITGGAWRGRSLAVPPSARPTEGRVREALFSIWGDRLAESRILDLFAGSGVVGLEALSRGAIAATLVEHDRQALRLLAENRLRLGEPPARIRRLRLPGGLGVLGREVGEKATEPFELVFADPPYRFSEYDRLLAAVAPLLANLPEASVAIEHSRRASLPETVEGLSQVDRRSYGECSVSFYEPAI